LEQLIAAEQQAAFSALDALGLIRTSSDGTVVYVPEELEAFSESEEE